MWKLIIGCHGAVVTLLAREAEGGDPGLESRLTHPAVGDSASIGLQGESSP